MEKKNVLFVSDIDRTLIFPKRFARDGDVCIEWTKDGNELNYINPDNLNTLAQLSKHIKLVLITARTKAQYQRIRWPAELELYRVLLCFGNEIYSTQEKQSDNIEQEYRLRSYGLRSYNEILNDAFQWLKPQNYFTECKIRGDRFILAHFKPNISERQKNWIAEDLYCEFCMESYVCNDRFYAVPMNNTKGDAVLTLAKEMKPEAIIIAGDSKPDVPMFSYADCAIYPNSLFGYAYGKNASTKKFMKVYKKELLTKYKGAIVSLAQTAMWQATQIT